MRPKMCAARPLAAALLLAGLVSASGLARADAYGDVRAQQAEVQRLDGERAQLEGRRVRLEHESRELGAEIEQLKRQSAGVRRDLRLQDLLAGAKARSDELERVAAELRWRASALEGARRKLIAACDRALAGTLPEARRLELARLRTVAATLVATGAPGPLGVGRAAADPLDGPRELSEKADLLRDSEDKLRREVQRLATRIDDVERRRHLRERAGAIDEDWFGEAVSNRKFARTTTTPGGATASTQAKTETPTTAPTAGRTATDPGAANGFATGGGGPAAAAPAPGVAGTQTPAPTAMPTAPPPSNTAPGGSLSDAEFGGNVGNSGGSPTATATVLRNLVDPATLDELRRADGTDDLERQVRALRRAQGELEGLANELGRRARTLSRRADELKTQK
jgi:hypothetical protein